MPNGEKIAHGDGKEDNEGRERNWTQNANIETSGNANIQVEVAEVDEEGEDKVDYRNDDNESNNDNTQGGKLRVKDVSKQNRTPTPRRNGSQTRNMKEYIRKSCDTITTPPSNSLIALARASMDCMSKWLVGSSIIDVSRWHQSRIRRRTEEEDMWVFHRQLSENDAKRERVSSVHVAKWQGRDRVHRAASCR